MCVTQNVNSLPKGCLNYSSCVYTRAPPPPQEPFFFHSLSPTFSYIQFGDLPKYLYICRFCQSLWPKSAHLSYLTNWKGSFSLLLVRLRNAAAFFFFLAICSILCVGNTEPEVGQSLRYDANNGRGQGERGLNSSESCSSGVSGRPQRDTKYGHVIG